MSYKAYRDKKLQDPETRFWFNVFSAIRALKEWTKNPNFNTDATSSGTLSF